MKTTNVNKWAMYSGIKMVTDLYDIGGLNRAHLAEYCRQARAPYIGKVHNFLLWVRDRWF